MRILVTGASGFVGRALVHSLAQGGHGVRAAARDPSALAGVANVEAAALPDLGGDIDWRPLLRDMEAVVHLAGIAHVSDAIPEARYDAVNRLATASLARAAAQSPGIRHVVFASSIRAQSGPSADRILTENDAPRPTDAYGRSKLAAEAVVRDCGVPATILRPVVIYGPRARANVGQLVRIASLPLPLPFASLRGRRSLLALDNMLAALRVVLDHPHTAGETYVVADPTPVSLPDMIGIMRRARGRAAGLLPCPPSVLEAGLRATGRGAAWERIGLSLQADAAKLRAAGWTPVTDAPQALAAMAKTG
jgi:UDP-glucose 4-epimerase